MPHPSAIPFPRRNAVQVRSGLAQLGLAAFLAAPPLACGLAFADAPQAAAGTFWQGEPGDAGQLSLTLFPRPGTERVEATLRYDSRLAATPRQLDGQLTADGRLSVRERDASPAAADDDMQAHGNIRFEGNVAPDGRSASGVWTGADGVARQLMLTRKAVYRERVTEAAGVRFTERYPETGNPALDALVASVRAGGCGEGERECRSAVELARLDAGTISLLRTTWRYSGGAHGSLDYAGGTWRRDDAAPVAGAAGEAVYVPVRLADLLAPGKDCVQKLNAELQASLQRQGAADPERGLLDEPALRDARTPFTLYRGGVVLHYAPYAVGPFAQGTYQVAVPFARLGACARQPGESRDRSPEPDQKEAQT
ncbi:RsiV family protein [Cupriavidus sp. 30B13]|uniref:RsiV family protein n=1 Tax=Cupriavidus sp. 30B13 TaxID=3384241 RepID=UPI003B9153A7